MIIKNGGTQDDYHKWVGGHKMVIKMGGLMNQVMNPKILHLRDGAQRTIWGAIICSTIKMSCKWTLKVAPIFSIKMPLIKLLIPWTKFRLE